MDQPFFFNSESGNDGAERTLLVGNLHSMTGDVISQRNESFQSEVEQQVHV